MSLVGYVITSRLTDPSIGNQYIRLKNGYWILASQKDTSDKAKEVIVSYVSLQHYLADKGIKFLYFYTPSKDCDIDNEYPDGVHSYVNENIDHNLDIMSNYGLNYVDLRKSLHDDGLNHYELFYKTDHHWTVWAGLWAASKVSKEITDRFGIKMIDPITICDYTPVTYKKAEFGSYGNGVTHYVAEPEDFTIYYPECKTNYRLEIPNKEIDVTGSFEEIFINYDELRKDEDSGGGYAYEKILYGNVPFEKNNKLQ